MKSLKNLISFLFCVLFMLNANAAESSLNHVVIVLDASGSMNRFMEKYGVNRWRAAQGALKEVMKQVTPDTRIGLLVFGSRNLRSDWAYPLAPLDTQKLSEAIDLPIPYGQTPLGAYIKKGGSALLEARNQNQGYGTYRLLVVTDGEANDGDLVDRYVPQVLAHGVTLDVIGVDLANTHTLAKRVSSYKNANDPSALRKAIAQVFAEVTNTKGAAGAVDFNFLKPIPFKVIDSMIKGLTKRADSKEGYWK